MYHDGIGSIFGAYVYSQRRFLIQSGVVGIADNTGYAFFADGNHTCYHYKHLQISQEKAIESNFVFDVVGNLYSDPDFLHMVSDVYQSGTAV